MKGLLRSTAKNLREGRNKTQENTNAGNAKGGNERGEGMRKTKDIMVFTQPNIIS